MTAPPGGSGAAVEWIRVAPADRLPPGRSVRLDVDGWRIALFHTPDGFHAVDDDCPHMGASLSEGRVEDGAVVCPWHAWRYELTTGDRTDRRGLGAVAHRVEVRDGWLYLGLVGQRSQQRLRPAARRPCAAAIPGSRNA
jgi:nitrite reductase/ring-hydroxylating ferredoxin subunit